jgi:PKD repeat protein
MKKVFTATVLCFFVFLGTAFSQDVSDIRANNLLKLQRYLGSVTTENKIYSEQQDLDELLSNTNNAINSNSGITILADAWFSTDPDDLAPLRGTTWNFTYTIINTYTDTLTFETTVQTTSDGYVLLPAEDQYSSQGAVFYMDLPQGGRGFGAIIESYIINQFYWFTVNGNTATGFYNLKDNSTGRYSDLYYMIGTKIGGATTTTTSIKPNTTTTSVNPTTTTTSVKPTTTTTIDASVKADFYGSPAAGEAPLTVKFTNLSTGTINAYEWDFGDNSTKNVEQNPTRTYEKAGTYSVSLTVTGINGNKDTKVEQSYITVTSPQMCPFKTTLKNSKDIDMLHMLRDKHFNTFYGKLLTSIFYRNSVEVNSILSAHPELQQRLRVLVAKNIVIAEALVYKGTANLPQRNADEITAFIIEIAKEGSLRLKFYTTLVTKGIEYRFLMNGVGLNLN